MLYTLSDTLALKLSNDSGQIDIGFGGTSTISPQDFVNKCSDAGVNTLTVPESFMLLLKHQIGNATPRINIINNGTETNVITD